MHEHTADNSGLEIADSGFPIYPVDPSLFPTPRLTRHEFISGLHEVLKPRTYLEIGVEDGFGLALSHAATIGVDPGFRITREIRTSLQLVRATSDEFFARDHPTEFFNGIPIDLAFVDGMHLVEFAYRDLMNVERFAGPGTVVVFDDVLPRNVHEAARERHSEFWSGDVYKLTAILHDLRPDLALILVNTDPTGCLVAVGLDPESQTLAEHYPAVVHAAKAPTGTAALDHVFRRSQVADPLDVLRWHGWPPIVNLRDSAPGQTDDLLHRMRADFPME